MADTGAPWNIPYVEPGDLVRDYPAASEALGTAIAGGLSNASIIKQVVQTVKTDVFTTTSGSFTTVTGLTRAITPTADTSKVLIVAQFYAASTGSTAGSFDRGVYRLAGGNSSTYVGAAAGSRTQAAIQSGTNAVNDSVTIVYLDSPATDSEVTYSVEALVGQGTLHVGRSFGDTDVAGFGRFASSLTCIEVAA